MSQATALDRRWIDWKSFDRGIGQSFRGLIIGHLMGLVFEALEGDAGSEVNERWWQTFELVERCHDQLLWVALADLAFGIDLFGGEVAGTVEVDVGVEEVAAEGIDVAGEALGNMRVAELLANDAAVFAFHQGVVVGVPRPRAGELDA